MTRFAGEIAVITGGGSGIGAAVAERIAAEGGKVILVGRTESKLNNIANRINENAQEPKAFPFVCDVTNEEDVKKLANYVKTTFGDLNILINNAGGSANSTIQETTVEQWEAMQDVNLKSVFLLAKTLGEIMIEKANEGNNVNRTIVNVASLSGHKPGARFPHYSAAKAAVINLTKALAYEYGRYGIRVNSISPGFVETPLIDGATQNEKFMNAIKRKKVMRRLGQPEEIANVVSFIASKENSFMTGTDILVDGGFLIS